MGQNLWLRIGAVGALSVKNPAPSDPDIRKHPSNRRSLLSDITIDNLCFEKAYFDNNGYE